MTDAAPDPATASRPTRAAPSGAAPSARRALHAAAAQAVATRAAPHVRDGLDLRRAMRCVLLAVLPCALVGAGNAGYQALLAARGRGLAAPPGSRGAFLAALGLAGSPESALACAVYGLACLLPILAVAGGVAWAWERLFARLRGRGPSEAFPVVAVLFALTLPPALPLWQVALGSSFAVVIGLEIFGGTGRNVVNPALAGFLFLYFAYPASFSGEGVWVGLRGSSATPVLPLLAAGGLPALEAQGPGWARTFTGLEPGALGETSALACLVGGAFLVHVGLASWRVIAGGVLGLVVTVALANAFGDPARPQIGLPAHWHLTSGSFAFALVFLATDPVTSTTTALGRLGYGALIGALTGLVRVFNPAHPEGAMMAVLLGNVLAPLLDHLVVRLHVRRRRRCRG
jgi:Na+-transporting NADH:ubiquinone oxidoreductase subunit B